MCDVVTTDGCAVDEIAAEAVKIAEAEKHSAESGRVPGRFRIDVYEDCSDFRMGYHRHWRFDTISDATGALFCLWNSCWEDSGERLSPGDIEDEVCGRTFLVVDTDVGRLVRLIEFGRSSELIMPVARIVNTQDGGVDVLNYEDWTNGRKPFEG